MKTSLAAGIDIAKNKADYDAACKRLLSEKIILAWIMKSCLDEFRGFDVNFIAEKCIEGTPFISEVPVNPDETVPVIRGMGQEQSSVTEGNVTFDIYFNAIVPGTEEPVHIIINMEAQSKYRPGYPLIKRSLYYCSRMISSQQGTVFTKADYGKIRKVYSIWICTRPPGDKRNTITRYRIAEDNLIGNAKDELASYDLLTIIMICIDTKNNCDFNEILKLLGVLFSKQTKPAEKKRILQEEFNIPMTQNLWRNCSRTLDCNSGRFCPRPTC
ncbi:MAG: Rpn family recombination-promoting nuclease/putative transposase [bacterium]|nr:Rpn family recombination-promoting nuclease/putative transposase [bacterium]